MIPRIDAQSLLNPLHPNHNTALSAVSNAASHVGFFTIYNTPFTIERLDALFATYREFFLLPAHEKAPWDMSVTGSNRGWGRPGSEQVNPQANPDFKQVFDSGFEWPEIDLPAYADNLWPDKPDNFQATLQSYYHDALEFTLDLLCSVAKAVGEDPDFFRNKFDKPMALLRGNYYPPRPSDASSLDFGIASHTDYGCVTLLATDGTPGLEVQLRNEQWHPVVTQPGDFVINFGEMLEMWTQKKIVATPHRVIGGESERLSIPLFFNPRYDTNVAPSGTKDPIRAVDHLQSRYDETYLHLKEKESDD